MLRFSQKKIYVTKITSILKKRIFYFFIKINLDPQLICPVKSRSNSTEYGNRNRRTFSTSLLNRLTLF